MKNLKSKIFVFLIIIIASVLFFQTQIYGANEDIQILKKEISGDYLIYIKDNLNTDFEFAFSNNTVEPVTYTSAGKDSLDPSANNVAYVDSATEATFTLDPGSTLPGGTLYMWARLESAPSTYIAVATEIDLAVAMEEVDFKQASDITKIINVNVKDTLTTTQDVDGKRITITVGKITLLNAGNYESQMVSLPSSTAYNNLMDLATRISKFNSTTDMYTQIQLYTSFLTLYNSLQPAAANPNWVPVAGNTILQPEGAQTGDQYIVWIKELATGKIDAQFMTSFREYSEQKITEIITTQLPVTYDNNTLLIVLGVLFVSIVAVFIVIKKLEKKENKG